MKYTAWPALVIVAVMVAARDGGRAAVRFTAVVLAAAAALVAALAPTALGNPASLLRNTVDYPLGLTGATSPAASPLPGHLLATLGSGGHLAALLLLAAAGIAIAASLVVAPPATPAAAARRVAIGLTALFLLAPATRFGYFIYPISLYAWAMLADRQRGTGPRDSGDQWSLGRVTGRLPARYGRRVHRVIGHSDGWGARQMPDPSASRGRVASRCRATGRSRRRRRRRPVRAETLRTGRCARLNLTRCHPLQFKPMSN